MGASFRLSETGFWGRVEKRIYRGRVGEPVNDIYTLTLMRLTCRNVGTSLLFGQLDQMSARLKRLIKEGKERSR